MRRDGKKKGHLPTSSSTSTKQANALCNATDQTCNTQARQQMQCWNVFFRDECNRSPVFWLNATEQMRHSQSQRMNYAMALMTHATDNNDKQKHRDAVYECLLPRRMHAAVLFCALTFVVLFFFCYQAHTRPRRYPMPAQLKTCREVCSLRLCCT